MKGFGATRNRRRPAGRRAVVLRPARNAPVRHTVWRRNVFHRTTDVRRSQGKAGHTEPVHGEATHSDSTDSDSGGASVVKTALGVAGGSAAGIGGLILAIGLLCFCSGLAVFAISTFGVIMLSALAVAAVFALRRR